MSEEDHYISLILVEYERDKPDSRTCKNTETAQIIDKLRTRTIPARALDNRKNIPHKTSRTVKLVDINSSMEKRGNLTRSKTVV